MERYRHVVTRFTSESDGGIYPAMNKGIQAASGDYLYFRNALLSANPIGVPFAEILVRKRQEIGVIPHSW